MLNTWMPDWEFSTFDKVDRIFLREQDIHAILLDIDNTLEPYENPEPGESVLSWFRMLEEEGVRVAFVSNNARERVDLFNRSLGYVAYTKAKKPFKRYLLRAMTDLHADREHTILMGDQIFTDIWAAHNAGIRAVLVPPIRDKRDLLTRTKRLLEKPILYRFRKRNSS